MRYRFLFSSSFFLPETIDVQLVFVFQALAISSIIYDLLVHVSGWFGWFVADGDTPSLFYHAIGTSVCYTLSSAATHSIVPPTRLLTIILSTTNGLPNICYIHIILPQ